MESVKNNFVFGNNISSQLCRMGFDQIDTQGESTSEELKNFQKVALFAVTFFAWMIEAPLRYIASILANGVIIIDIPFAMADYCLGGESCHKVIGFIDDFDRFLAIVAGCLSDYELSQLELERQKYNVDKLFFKNPRDLAKETHSDYHKAYAAVLLREPETETERWQSDPRGAYVDHILASITPAREASKKELQAYEEVEGVLAERAFAAILKGDQMLKTAEGPLKRSRLEVFLAHAKLAQAEIAWRKCRGSAETAAEKAAFEKYQAASRSFEALLSREQAKVEELAKGCFRVEGWPNFSPLS